MSKQAAVKSQSTLVTCSKCKRVGSGFSNHGGWGVVYNKRGKGRLLCGACLRKMR